MKYCLLIAFFCSFLLIQEGCGAEREQRAEWYLGISEEDDSDASLSSSLSSEESSSEMMIVSSSSQGQDSWAKRQFMSMHNQYKSLDQKNLLVPSYLFLNTSLLGITTALHKYVNGSDENCNAHRSFLTSIGLIAIASVVLNQLSKNTIRYNLFEKHFLPVFALVTLLFPYIYTVLHTPGDLISVSCLRTITELAFPLVVLSFLFCVTSLFIEEPPVYWRDIGRK